MELPPEARETLAARNERSLLVQACGCFGCLGVVIGVMVLIGLWVLQADQATQIEPAAVEQNLQAIVSCEVPEGYRGFRGFVRGERRIATLTPHTHSGLEVPLTGRLTLSLWTVPKGTDLLPELETYWRGKILEHYGPRVDVPEPIEGTLTLRVRGEPVQARSLVFAREDERIQILFATFPRAAGSEELVALTCAAGEERFDRASLDAFLASIK